MGHAANGVGDMIHNQFMDWFGLTAPILQAPIGSCASIALVKAVGQGGGMGSLPLTWTPADDAIESITKLKAAEVPFFVNFVLRFPHTRFEKILDAQPPAVTFSWGINATAMALAKAKNTKVGVQVATVAGALAARDAGADFVIVQGTEAGGHVQSSTPLFELLKNAIAAVSGVPIIAAGGISSGAEIGATLKAGAAAVMMGTRFVATQESGAHPLYKEALVKAKASDTVYTNCFDIDWPYSMHRVLRNSTFRMWEDAGCPAAPHRPGEGDVVARAQEKVIIRYSDTSPSSSLSGDVLAACLYAGTGVDHIHDIPPAADLVRRLWAEAEAWSSKN